MRVLLTSQEVPPETGWGGIGTYIGTIAPALAAAGAEVHVLSVVRGQERSDVVRADGVHVHRRPLRRPPGVGQLLRGPETWNRVSLAVAVALEVRSLDVGPDVVECPEWMAEAAVLALRPPAPLVVRLHSSAHQVLPWLGPLGPDQRLAIRLEDATVRRAHLVTGTRAQLVTVAPRLGLSAAALEEITYPVSPRPAAGSIDGSPRICFAGRFTRRKGPDVLVEALPAVRERVPGARLALVGRDGVDAAWGSSVKAHLQQQADRLGVGDALEWVERWGTDAVTEEASRSTVVAVPSQWESFGYVAAEALAIGRPVIASDIPALADVVDDGRSGRLVPVGDVAAWAAALADLLEDPAKARAMGAAGAEAMGDRCDPAVVAERTLRAYVRAIERARRGERAA